MNRDSFRIENGYSWDCCIVFKVRKANEVLTAKHNENSIKKIVNKLNRAGLETRLFYSIQHDEVYCKIRCSLQRLMQEADRSGYRLLLDSVNLETLMVAGRKGKWDGVKIPFPSPQTPLHPYEYIYAEYKYDSLTRNTREELINIYKRRTNNTYFRGIDRLKLITGIIREKEKAGGCHLDLRGLQFEECILGFIMLHDNVELRTLEANWLVFFQFPWKQEVDMVTISPHSHCRLTFFTFSIGQRLFRRESRSLLRMAWALYHLAASRRFHRHNDLDQCGDGGQRPQCTRDTLLLRLYGALGNLLPRVLEEKRGILLHALGHTWYGAL